jgi:hypothetical protein
MDKAQTDNLSETTLVCCCKWFVGRQDSRKYERAQKQKLQYPVESTVRQKATNRATEDLLVSDIDRIKAEFIPACSMMKAAIFLRKCLTEIGFAHTTPTPVVADNENGIGWSEGLRRWQSLVSV